MQDLLGCTLQIGSGLFKRHDIHKVAVGAITIGCSCSKISLLGACNHPSLLVTLAAVSSRLKRFKDIDRLEQSGIDGFDTNIRQDTLVEQHL